jgi:hypothetical protein
MPSIRLRIRSAPSTTCCTPSPRGRSSRSDPRRCHGAPDPPRHTARAAQYRVDTVAPPARPGRRPGQRSHRLHSGSRCTLEPDQAALPHRTKPIRQRLGSVRLAPTWGAHSSVTAFVDATSSASGSTAGTDVAGHRACTATSHNGHERYRAGRAVLSVIKPPVRL